MKAGKLDQAIDLLNKELSINPKNELAWNDLTVAYMNKNDMPNMKKAIDGALALSESAVTPLSNLGQYYVRLQDWDNAILAFEKAIKANYKSTGLYWPLAYAYNQKKRTADVATAIEAFAINGGNMDQAYQMGIAASKNNPALNNFLRSKQAYFKGDGQTTFSALDLSLKADPNYKPAKDFKAALEKARQGK